MQREIGIIIKVKNAAQAKEEIKQIVDKQVLEHLKRFNGQLKETGDNTARLGAKAAEAKGGLDSFFKTAMKGAGVLYSLKRGLSFAMESFESGAGLERAATQFESSIGRINEVLPSLRAATRGTVDDMKLLATANRSVMEGLNPKDLAKMYQMATVASRKLGLDSEQAIQTISNAIVRQDESALTTLGTIMKMNIGLKVQSALIAKNGGVMSGAMAVAIRQSVIMGELNRKFGGFNKLQEDSVEILQRFRASMDNLKMSIGQVLGTALAPLLKIVSSLADATSQFLHVVKDTAGFKTFIQYMVVLAGLFTAKGLIGSIIMAAKYLGVFVGGLKMAAILAGGFIGFKVLGGDLKDLAGFAEKTKTAFSVLFQLLTNYDSETGMTSVLTKDKEAVGGLFNVLFTLAKAFLAVKAVATGFFKGISNVLKAVLPSMGSFGQAILSVMNSLSNGEPILQSTLNKLEKMGEMAAYVATTFFTWFKVKALIIALSGILATLAAGFETARIAYIAFTATANSMGWARTTLAAIGLVTKALWGQAAAWAAANPILAAGTVMAGVGVAAYMGVGSDEPTQSKHTDMNRMAASMNAKPEMRSQNVDHAAPNFEDFITAITKPMNKIADTNEQMLRIDEQSSLESKVQGMWGATPLATK